MANTETQAATSATAEAAEGGLLDQILTQSKIARSDTERTRARDLIAELVAQVRRTRQAGGRVVAVGTTVVRALESAMQDGELRPFAGETRIFIFPGYRITSVDGLLTNFHLPESTLLMLVSAFAGKERVFEAYRHAVEQRYRFFSYGDAMLLWGQG